jgi:hypothetical protein
VILEIPFRPPWEAVVRAHRTLFDLAGALCVLQEELVLPGDTVTEGERAEVRTLEEKLTKLESDAVALMKEIQTLSDEKIGLKEANIDMKQENAALAKKAEGYFLSE